MQINAVSLECQDFQDDATTCGIMQLNECSKQERQPQAGIVFGSGGVAPECNDRRTEDGRELGDGSWKHQMPSHPSEPDSKDRSAAHSNAIAALDGMSWQPETDVVILLPLWAAIKLEPEIEMQLLPVPFAPTPSPATDSSVNKMMRK